LLGQLVDLLGLLLGNLEIGPDILVGEQRKQRGLERADPSEPDPLGEPSWGEPALGELAAALGEFLLPLLAGNRSGQQSECQKDCAHCEQCSHRIALQVNRCGLPDSAAQASRYREITSYDKLPQARLQASGLDLSNLER